MTYIKKYAVPLLIIIISLSLMYVLRSLPSAKMWNGYTMMYVDAAAESSFVIQLLEKNGCKDFICLENQKVPLAFSKQTPEAALATSGIEKSEYYQKRKNFFYDKNKQVKVIYVPERFKKNTLQVISILSKQGINSGWGENVSYPFIAVLVCIILAVILTFFSEKKVLYAVLSVFPILFSIVLPFYRVLAGNCLFISGIFICEKLWKREKAFSVILKNVYINIFFLSAFFMMLLSGLKCFLLFFCVVLSDLSIMSLYSSLEKRLEQRFSFVPIKIRSAKFVPTFTERISFQLLSCSCAIAAILLVAFLYSAFSLGQATKSSNLQLPSQNGNGQLPNIKDFVEWKWEATTFPYISLNEKNSSTKQISFSQFKMEDGLIKEEVKSIAFNQNFIEESINDIDDLNFPAIEKMLKLQKKDFSGGYASSTSQNLTILTIIIILLSLQIPLICRLVYKIRIKGFKKR